MPFTARPPNSGNPFQGIADAGQSIGDMIQRHIAQAKEAKAYRAMAVDALGMDPDKADQMTLPELQGTMAGEALKRSNIGQQLMQENEKLKTQLGAANLAVVQNHQHAVSMFNDLISKYGGGGAGPAQDASADQGGETAQQPQQDNADLGGEAAFNPGSVINAMGGGAGTLTPDAIARLGAQAGLPPSEVGEYMQQFGRGQYFNARADVENAPADSPTAATPVSTPIPNTDMVSVTYPGLKQAFMVPKAQAEARTQDLMNPDGSPAGQAIFNGKVWVINKGASAGFTADDFGRLPSKPGEPPILFNKKTGQLHTVSANGAMAQLNNMFSGGAGATAAPPTTSPSVQPPMLKTADGRVISYKGAPGDADAMKDPANWELQNGQ